MKWSDELKRRYLASEASQFVLHGNVHDQVLSGGTMQGVVDYLGGLLATSKDVVIEYNIASGIRFIKNSAKLDNLDELLLQRSPDKVLPVLERVLLTVDRVALIVSYAEMIAPASDASFSSDTDRQSVITLHRWSLSPVLEKSDNLTILVTENLAELHPKLVGNPRTVALQVGMPTEEERAAVIAHVAPSYDPSWRARLAEVTAGLKAVQLKTLIAPLSSTTEISLDVPDTVDTKARDELLQLIYERKRELIERECFGLIEFVESSHDFSVVGGIEVVKKELLAIAANMREGRRQRCPMGMLFTGPMGTGKTFVAEAFIKETGLTAVKLKNFRSKWVGATEGNLDKILSVIQAIGQVIVIIDEGDRAFGSQDGEGDGGTSSRVIARIKEFMSDTDNRGRVMFILMTNRPDKLDIDIKRAGRLDKKIPFVYPQDPAEVESVLAALLRKHRVKHDLQFPRDRESVSSRLVGYANAETEAVVLLAAEYAADTPMSTKHIADAVRDYLPSRDAMMLEYMELIAVFEASNRKMLPAKYAEMTNDALQARLNELRLLVAHRR